MQDSRIFKYTLLFLFLIPQYSSGQEKLVGLEENPVLRKLDGGKERLKNFLYTDTLELPFFDDFSRNTIYPDYYLWEDQDVFVNFTYAVQPVSIGVATFDAVDSSGVIYERASVFPFISDRLTSRPIDLDYPPSDSIYLSFYYQPMGNGDNPQEQDSLILEFYSVSDTAWVPVWKIPGDTLRDFKQVMVPVSETRFLHNGFRFRFYNYASIASGNQDPGEVSNCDFWHLDYVYLDRNRFQADTVPHDVAITAPLKSLLLNYEAMPWKHFREVFLAEMGSFIPVQYTNNDSIVRQNTRNFEIRDVYLDALVHSYSGGAFNSDPWEIINYNSVLIYTYDSPFNDSALFEVKAYLLTDDFDRKINDTVIFTQAFYDYFAYDDGSAEAGYGVSGRGTSNAAVAYRFEAQVPDSIKTIRFYFNRSFRDASITYFNLTVWGNNDGIPGEILYSKESVKPEYEDSLNYFYEYKLDTAVLVDGIFYVGWEQTSEVFLNVGFDRNRVKNSRLLYRENGEWYFSQFQGALMVRPALSNRLLTALPNTLSEPDWFIYPNPATEFIRLHLSYPATTFRATIYSLHGQVLKSVVNQEIIDISTLHPGMYILEVNTDGTPLRKKFLKMQH